MQSKEEITAGHWLKETQKGYIRIAVLILLSKKPYHGYEIMREIKERTSGFWRPTAGGIYPILRNLEDSDYVEGKWDLQKKRKKKIFQITDAGKQVLERSLAKESQISSGISSLFTEYMKDVLDIEKPVSIPRFPHLFSVFLEERKEKPEDTVNTLTRKKNQIEKMIKELLGRQKSINERIVQLERFERKGTKQT
ncbi:MAG TPA: PadR family transcriptional regulator [Candidatus Acidoferrum sp.]|nr:PadR family transcriptional regulator [Candidatus Acidoferrum sp.]